MPRRRHCSVSHVNSVMHRPTYALCARIKNEEFERMRRMQRMLEQKLWGSAASSLSWRTPKVQLPLP